MCMCVHTLTHHIPVHNPRQRGEGHNGAHGVVAELLSSCKLNAAQPEAHCGPRYLKKRVIKKRFTVPIHIKNKITYH